jgi:hypothetical protein
MLTPAQREVVEQAGVEVATVRLAAMSGSKSGTPILSYAGLPPAKRDVEVWLKSELYRQRAKTTFLGLIVVMSLIVVASGHWELVRTAVL